MPIRRAPRHHRKRPIRRQTDASRMIHATRRRARLTITQLAAMMNVHPRTITRWETGETKPNAEEWARLTAVLAQYVPADAVALAQLVGAPSPLPPPRVADVRAIEDALLRAADRLDVAPGRVRAVVRELVAVLVQAQGTLDDLARAAQERVREEVPGVSPA